MNAPVKVKRRKTWRRPPPEYLYEPWEIVTFADEPTYENWLKFWQLLLSENGDLLQRSEIVIEGVVRPAKYERRLG